MKTATYSRIRVERHGSCLVGEGASISLWSLVERRSARSAGSPFSMSLLLLEGAIAMVSVSSGLRIVDVVEGFKTV